MKATSLLLILFMAVVNGSWAQLGSHFATDTVTASSLVASSFINDHEGWVADIAGTLWHTSNTGATWTSIPTGKNILKLDFTDHLNGYGLTMDTAYKSEDGGSTWSALTIPGVIGKAIYFLNKDTGFISGIGVIYKTNDGGASWITVSTGSASVVDYFFVNHSVGIAAALDEEESNSIWRTTDGGLSWSSVYNIEDYFMNSIWFTSENVGWAAGYFDRTGRGKLPVINRTNDGGLTWENVYMNSNPGDEKGEELIDIRFRNENLGLALSTYSENVFTLDGGLTWNPTYVDDRDLIPSYGVYKTLDGYNNMYLIGRKGYFTKWH